MESIGSNESLRKETFPSLSDSLLENILEVEKLGASYIALICGFWYEWSVALGEHSFGFDSKDKKVTFFDDDGNTRIDTSTLSQCGEALAALLSLPEGGVSPSLSDWKNKALYFRSFTVSQRDMLDSVHRVTGSSDEDWEIFYQPSKERYQDGLKEMQDGVHTCFVKVMYTRNFYPEQNGAKEFANEEARVAKGGSRRGNKESRGYGRERLENLWSLIRLGLAFSTLTFERTYQHFQLL